MLAASVAVAADEAPYMKGKRFAVGDYTGGKVCIVEPDGRVSWEQKAPSCNDLEISPEGKIAWELSNKDIPGQPLKFLAGFQKLPTGNLLISNWLGHGKFGTAPHLLEVTRAKKVVWTCADHQTFKTTSVPWDAGC